MSKKLIKKYEERLKSSGADYPTYPLNKIGILVPLSDLKSMLKLAKRGINALK